MIAHSLFTAARKIPRMAVLGILFYHKKSISSTQTAARFRYDFVFRLSAVGVNPP